MCNNCGKISLFLFGWFNFYFYLCSDKNELLKKQGRMKTLTEEIIMVTVPTDEMRFFKTLCKKMGWKNRKRRKTTVKTDEPV